MIMMIIGGLLLLFGLSVGVVLGAVGQAMSDRWVTESLYEDITALRQSLRLARLAQAKEEREVSRRRWRESALDQLAHRPAGGAR